MKSSFTLIFLLFAFTAKSSFFVQANIDSSPVLDIHGDPLQTGVEYFVVSLIWGAGGGGLALGRFPDQQCPEIIIQRLSDFDQGLPVTFSNVNSTEETIYENINVNVETVPIRDKLCTTSTIWKVDYGKAADKWFVITDGAKNETTSSFKIKSNGSNFGYKFNYCSSEDSCSDIGKYWDDGQVRLGLEEFGWPWTFVKATAIKQVVYAS